jgi:hypothetical protein
LFASLFVLGFLSGAVDFRQKLDAQRSAVLATEIKNNGFKLARWTAQALLSGADEMKIGYVTRTSARESKAHAVLGVQRYKAVDLAQQLNLEAGRMWGTLRRLSEAVLDMPDGKYLLIKEPNEVRFGSARLCLVDVCLTIHSERLAFLYHHCTVVFATHFHPCHMLCHSRLIALLWCISRHLCFQSCRPSCRFTRCPSRTALTTRPCPAKTRTTSDIVSAVFVCCRLCVSGYQVVLVEISAMAIFSFFFHSHTNQTSN